MRLMIISEATNRRDFLKRTAAAYNAMMGRIPAQATSVLKSDEKKAEKIPKIEEYIDYGIFSDGILPTSSGNFYIKPEYLYSFATDHVLSVLGINRASASNIMDIITGIQKSSSDKDSKEQLEARLAQISKKTEITPERIGAIIAANEDINRSIGLDSLDNIIYWIKKKNVSDEVAHRVFAGYVNQLGGPLALADLIKDLLSSGSGYAKMKRQNNEAILPPIGNMLKIPSIKKYLTTKIAPELPEGIQSLEGPQSFDGDVDWYYDDSRDPFYNTKERFYESKKIKKSII